MSTTSKSSEFGYYPFPIDLKGDRFSIETLPNLDGAIHSVKAHKNTFGSWIYSGPRVRQVSKDVTAELPYPQRIFGLPKTHRLTIQTDDDEAMSFVVWCLSFFLGMELTTTEAGYLDGAPIEPGHLTDFVINDDPGRVVDIALNILAAEGENSEVPARYAAVIQALILSKYHQYLPFERFHYAYVAIDGCYRFQAKRVNLRRDIPHGQRIMWVCNELSVPVPSWADPTSANNIASERNLAVHEALFFGGPLGYKTISQSPKWSAEGNVIEQMQALVCRLLVALFGFGHTVYAGSSATSRQNQLLSLA
ncbi:hypothetical protein [Comamonas sp.]|uniref:hypothetical protein n=1 Tax=Comamonas sp. TaxID=34028 RepID=UPI002897ADCF|nr:hypothetical protein [Comamonas sp.]